MFKNSLKLLAVAMMALALTACSGGKPQIMGMDGSEVPAAFAHFPDVPFPDRSLLDLDETKVLGSGESWIGTVVFAVPYDTSATFDFYISEMPKLRWTEVASVRSRISHLTYVRGNRAMQILIENKFPKKSVVTITAIPNKAGL